MADDIIRIRQPEYRITIQETELPVIISADGPQGPEGPEGPQGAPGGAVYEFTQSTPSSTWVINHNLGLEPDVTCIVAGEEVYPDVIYSTLNQATLVFGAPHAGKARLRP